MIDEIFPSREPDPDSNPREESERLDKDASGAEGLETRPEVLAVIEHLESPPPPFFWERLRYYGGKGAKGESADALPAADK